MDEALVHLGCDAQTSGGLLIAVAPDRLEKLEQALAQRGVKAHVIGKFVGPSNGRIVVRKGLTGLTDPDVSGCTAARLLPHTPPTKEKSPELYRQRKA